ncbi:MAG: phosphatase PAP2 family protein [Chlamydiae bacterium]|nr:phosphatase PAP2 family protein [Chlamydiota bacterium]
MSSPRTISFLPQWRLKPLIVTHLLIAAGFITLFSPLTHGFWQAIDLFFFKMLNTTLEWGRPWQVLWAIANHKYADWIEDLVIIIFSYMYIRSGLKEQKLYRISQILFILFYSAFIIAFVNKTVFHDWIRISRDSPTLVVDSCIKLSEHISWLKIKDGSTKSFPGDHATTAIIFGATFIYLGSRKMKICASIYAVFLCLPRMILGAHWLTDVIIGSGSIALFFLMWAVCSPLSNRCIKAIENFLLLFKKKNLSRRSS